ncbi:hypothetical protein EDC04DRAFT_2601992 [Pisolithus marmoratus]|nr:hypothetical protein EDC04DRAFT_2601992 [Pisolithus marmoratus]
MAYQGFLGSEGPAYGLWFLYLEWMPGNAWVPLHPYVPAMHAMDLELVLLPGMPPGILATSPMSPPHCIYVGWPGSAVRGSRLQCFFSWRGQKYHDCAMPSAVMNNEIINSEAESSYKGLELEVETAKLEQLQLHPMTPKENETFGGGMEVQDDDAMMMEVDEESVPRGSGSWHASSEAGPSTQAHCLLPFMGRSPSANREPWYPFEKLEMKTLNILNLAGFVYKQQVTKAGVRVWVTEWYRPQYHMSPRWDGNLYGFVEDQFLTYETHLEQLTKAVQFWPPTEQIKLAGKKWLTMCSLQLMAQMNKAYFPQTVMLKDGADTLESTVLKQSNSDCGKHIILPTAVSKYWTWKYLKSCIDDKGFWMSQD